LADDLASEGTLTGRRANFSELNTRPGDNKGRSEVLFHAQGSVAALRRKLLESVGHDVESRRLATENNNMRYAHQPQISCGTSNSLFCSLILFFWYI